MGARYISIAKAGSEGKKLPSMMKDKVNRDKQEGVVAGRRVRNIALPLLTILIVIAISVGIFYFYRHYPSRIEQLRAYGYLGAFIISIIFNATVILPVGNIVILTALGATLPSAALVGVAGGAGAAIGEITGYLAGYSGSQLVVRRGMYHRVEWWVKRWGSLTIFILSVVPLVFDLAGLVAGALRFPLWKFLLLCWLGRSILYVVFVVLAAMGLKMIIPWLG